jgi:putative flippase GtrA
MRAVIERLWRLYQTPHGKKLVRYGMVSAVSAVIAFTILTVVYGVLQLWSEVPSALFSNILATFPNYYLNRRWVWGKSGRSHLWREVVPFWVMSITGIVLALLTASLAHHFSDTHDLSHVARTVVIVGANTAAFGVLWILKFLILNRLFRSLPVTASDEEVDPSPVAPNGPGKVPTTVPSGSVPKEGVADLSVRLAETAPE